MSKSLKEGERQMNRQLQIMCFLVLLTPFQSQAFQFAAYGTTAESCYAKSMVGMDSVINARMGVLPEHALTLSLKTGSISDENSTYFTDTLTIILDAYMWQDTPHSYAINVFFQCAGGGAPPTHSAKAEM